MSVLKIILTSLLSITELFILTKIMGKRQISQLNFFDYINGITIGSIAAEMAIEGFNETLNCAVALAIYAFVSIAISFATDKSKKCRKVLNGTPIMLMDNGKISKRALSKAKLDVDELLMLCRINGYFNIDDIQTIIIESNGMISILPKTDSKPASPKDMNLAPQQENIFVTLVSDGQVVNENLNALGKSEKWLQSEISKKGGVSIENTMLAAFDGKDKFVCVGKCSESEFNNNFS